MIKLPDPVSAPPRVMFPPVVSTVVPVVLLVKAAGSVVVQAADAASVVAPKLTAMALVPALVRPAAPSVKVPPLAFNVPALIAIVGAVNEPPFRFSAVSLPAVPAAPVPPLADSVAAVLRVVVPVV